VDNVTIPRVKRILVKSHHYTYGYYISLSLPVSVWILWRITSAARQQFFNIILYNAITVKNQILLIASC